MISVRQWADSASPDCNRNATMLIDISRLRIVFHELNFTQFFCILYNIGNVLQGFELYLSNRAMPGIVLQLSIHTVLFGFGLSLLEQTSVAGIVSQHKYCERSSNFLRVGHPIKWGEISCRNSI